MLKRVTIDEARTALPELIDAARGGTEIVILHEGQPVAHLVGHVPARRAPGGATGWIAEDFDAPLDGEIGAAFRGERA